MRKVNAGGTILTAQQLYTQNFRALAKASIPMMMASGNVSPLHVRYEPSPADMYPLSAEWALRLLELGDRGEVSLEPTETAISLGKLARLEGWPNGQVVCLMEDFAHESVRTLWPHIPTQQFPVVKEAFREAETLPRLSLGIVIDGADLSSPLVGFARRLPPTEPGHPLHGDGWYKAFNTKVRVPYHKLAVLREPDGEALGVDYLSEGDSRKVKAALEEVAV